MTETSSNIIQFPFDYLLPFNSLKITNDIQKDEDLHIPQAANNSNGTVVILKTRNKIYD